MEEFLREAAESKARVQLVLATTELYGEVFAFDVDSVSLHGRDGTTIHVSRAHVLYACYDPQDAD